MRTIRLLVLIAIAMMAVAPLATAQDDGLRMGLVIHSDPTRPFWTVVHNGARAAAERYGVTITFQGSRDPLEQAQFVEDLIAIGVDGIAVTLANPDAMRDSIALALEAGIPVVSFNSGSNDFVSAGALMHFGQTEVIAGQGAGLRFNDMGVSKVICVNHQSYNIGLDERCAGLEATFAGEVERLDVTATGSEDLLGTQSTLQTKLLSDPSIEAVLTLNPTIAIAARDAINLERPGEVILGTFDLSSEVLDGIEAGEISFAIDQQPYLQGYYSVSALVLAVENANTLGGGLPVLTGPGFVDASNAAAVREGAARGTR
jgi:simple sugar transport system substrate-binding protein